MRAEAMIFVVNAREVILTSKKEQSFSKLAKRQLASGKERRSKTNLKRIYSRRLEREATQTRSYPESWIYTIPRRTYSNLEAELKAKLNSTTIATFTCQIPSTKAVQSISKPESFHCRFSKLWRGSCWHSKKDKIPDWPEQCLNLLTFTKDEWQTSWRPVLNPSPRDKSATWTLLIQWSRQWA